LENAASADARARSAFERKAIKCAMYQKTVTFALRRGGGLW
jgi:hypothetical protein